MNFFHNTTKYAHCRSEDAAVFDFIDRNRSVKHVVAFARDRTDTGEMSTMFKHLSSPADLTTSSTIDSFRFVLVSLFFGDFNNDHVLSACCHKFTRRG
jgi:hypothetical protein